MAQDVLADKDKIVVIGGSAGSLPVIMHTIKHLRPELRIPVVIVLHRKNDFESSLSNLMGLKTKLHVREADDKDPIIPGIIYLAPPDYHLLIEMNRHFSLDDSEKVHFSRPSIDVTFQTAADAYGRGTAAILLSGANADGVDGLATIKKAKGTIAVQDPMDAQVPYMPQMALNAMSISHVLSADGIADFINSLQTG